MSVTSINTNLAAYFAQQNIGVAQDNVTASVARLSSGNAITKASDNVSALSIGTSLASNVSTLKVAQQNAAQANTLLQVAGGALAQITDILQRQQELSAQAVSGSLTNVQRGFLDQEFQALTTALDSLVGQTNFNGVRLLDGTLSQQSNLGSATTQATKAAATLTFVNNPLDGQTVIIGGQTLTIKASPASALQVQLGSTTAQTVANLADKLNELATNPTYATSIGGAIYSAQGNTLNITARTGGSLGENFKINMAGTATANGGAAIGGEFGGSYNADVFGTGFTSPSTTISAATASAAAPFQVDDVLTAIVGTGAPVALYTVQANDSLQDIINGINANTATTGIKADLIYSSSAYNMRLSYSNATANIDFIGGHNYSGGSHALVNGLHQVSMFTANGLSGAVVATTATAAAPFQAGDALTATIGTGASKRSVTLATGAEMTNGLTLTQLVAVINSHANTTGVRAALNGGSDNINLTYYDPTATSSTGQSLVLNAGNNFYNGGTTTGQTYLLNNPYSQFRLFSSNLAATTGTAAAATAATPLQQGNTISVAIAGVGTVSFSIGASDTLVTIADGLNANAASQGFTNFHANIFKTGGNYNLDFYYYNTDVNTPAVITVNPGANAKAGTTNSTMLAPANASGITHTAADTVTHQAVYGLSGGIDDGLGLANTTASGTVGDNILTGLVQTKANVILSIPAIDASSLSATLATQTVAIAGQTFTFVASADSPDQVQIGSTLQETLDNLVSTINSYVADGHATGNTAYQLNQVNIARDGNSIVFTGKNFSNIADLSGSTTTVTTSLTTATLTHSGTLDNASFGGVDASGISNVAFTGTLSGFTAAYGSANTADLSVKIGNYTYTASSVNTNPTSNTTIRFYSNTLGDGSNGGYFDVQMQANNGVSVTNQSTANTFAQRFNAAFSSLNFLQQRNVSSYTGAQTIVSGGVTIGSLVGSSVDVQLGSYDNAKVSSITVTAPQGSSSNAQIAININGETFLTSPTLGNKLGANQTYRLTSTSDANHYVDFTTGDSTIDLDSTEKAQAVQNALLTAFGAGNGSAALSFQIGTSSTDVIKVSINSVSSSTLFGGRTLSVATQEDAAAAGVVVSAALEAVVSVSATVGALQQSFNYASANLSTSIQNQDSARSQFLDTDIASESTNFATAQVKLQAGISTLAQANQQLQNLLKLLG